MDIEKSLNFLNPDMSAELFVINEHEEEKINKGSSDQFNYSQDQIISNENQMYPYSYQSKEKEQNDRPDNSYNQIMHEINQQIYK